MYFPPKKSKISSEQTTNSSPIPPKAHLQFHANLLHDLPHPRDWNLFDEVSNEKIPHQFLHKDVSPFSLENALKRKGISKEFGEWFAIAKDRSKWRQLTHSNLQSQTSWCLMAEGHHESKRLQLLYAKGHSAQSDLIWRLHFPRTICHRGVSLYLGSIN